MQKNNNYEPIQDYGIIGNLHTVALVSTKGSIDFMCFPRFDAPTVFARLLDYEKGGHFAIQPQLSNITYKQLYLPDTAILITRYLAEEGIVEITDFMPVKEKEEDCTVIRQIRVVRGKVSFKVHCGIRSNNARDDPKMKKKKNNVFFISPKGDQPILRLFSKEELIVSSKGVTAEFTLNESERTCFVLESAPSEKVFDEPLDEYVKNAYRETIDYWKKWISNSTYKGRWREEVNRSALVLKLLTSYKYGSMIAAPTFGLPEIIGGKKNWDYRYTWIRDASFAMAAFLRLGFLKEAGDFINWIFQRCNEGELQLMYAVDGKNELKEKTLDDLDGYKGSKPVRIGNKAYRQFQLDIYGELIDTVYLYDRAGGNITYDFWQQIRKQIEIVSKNWKKKDHSIWEVRHEKKQYFYSSMMCWIAVDRAIKIAEHHSYPYPRNEWYTLRNDIFHDLYHNFWSDEKEAFAQAKGENVLDASVLLLPLRDVLSPFDSKWQSTMKAIDKHLRMDVLIYRYRNHDDGVEDKKQEGTFTMCSFWFIECLVKAGEVERARENFEKMLGYSNHLGLFSEQLGVKGEHLGNYPQALTHLALISAALTLEKSLEEKHPSHHSPPSF